MKARDTALFAVALLAILVAACGPASGADAPPSQPAAVVASPSPAAGATSSAAASETAATVVAPATSSPLAGGSLRLPPPATLGPASMGATASRVVIPSYGIDLAVVPGDTQVEGNDPGFPLCDVAQYLMGYRQPGEAGTTYLYAHAQRGMFLPLLEASQRDDGREMLGREVLVYTDDLMVYRYEIYTVNRHATDYLLADSVRPGDQRLILQTSEGPRGTVPKLQVGARVLGSSAATAADAFALTPEPRACS